MQLTINYWRRTLVEHIVLAVREADDARIRLLLEQLVPLADPHILLLLRSRLCGDTSDQ
ncbi:hypothetical protein [Streptomyces sp. NPDC001758]